MELEGLKRGLKFLEDQQVPVGDLITDRHVQVKKFMRVEKPEIRHWFDVWHMGKGIYKKLECKARKKNMEVIGLWSRSISNHIYWCAASSNGDGEMVVQKWKSIMNHVSNIHSGHGDKFPDCQHPPLDDRMWIKKDSRAHQEMEKIICSKHLLKDIPKLSPAEQTSSLEAFHKIVCCFAPKSSHFFYEAMEARLCLAALHFNANTGREQAVTKTGKPQFSVSFPKGRKGDAVVKPIKGKLNYDYVDELMGEVIVRRLHRSTYREARIEKESEMGPKPPSIASKYGPVAKEELIRSHISRFNR